MSLSSIIGAAGSALTASQTRIAVANNNVSNADDLNYTRKSVTTSATTTTLALSQSSMQRAADSYLTKAVLKTAAAAGGDKVTDTYMQSYDASLGSTDGSDDISSLMSAFGTSLSSLSSSTDATTKAQTVSDASALAQSISSLSASVQDLRTQANNQIGTTVDSINSSLKTLASLNDQIASVTAQGGDTTALEDSRDTALTTLSGLIGVNSYTTSDNQLRVYTTGGDALLGTTAATLNYTASSTLGASSIYPDTISGITLGDKDITTSQTSGELGALVTLRDTTLPAEQDKLDAMASTLITQVNAVTNAGTPVPAPSTLTSASTVNGGDSFSASGTLRVAVTDSSGKVVSTSDLDLSSYSSIDDVVSALDGVDGISASIGSDGKLTVTTDDSTTGVSMADDGAGVSAMFGFNNLFSGTSASNIAVSSSLAKDSSGLPTAVLSTSTTLNTGDLALSSGDSTVADNLSSLLSTSVTFAATGSQAAKTVSLSSYASSFVASAASMISTASTQSDTSTANSDAATTRLQNTTAVNIDEELANITQYQAQYEANAQLISIAKDLFDALVSMVN